MRRAVVTNSGFVRDTHVIQASYQFDNIKQVDADEMRTVYTATMISPVTVPCTITISDSTILIAGMDGQSIKIEY